MSVTADDLLARIKRRVTQPATQRLLDDADMLALANDVIREKMVPLHLSANQDYFVTTYIQPTVAGQATYPINYRAIARGLRDLKLVNAGNSQNTYNLRLIALEDEHLFSSQSNPTGFYFTGDTITLLPTPVNADYNIKQFINLQRGALVTVANAAQITNITGTTLTVSSLPATMTAGIAIDFIQGTSGCSTLAWDQTITSNSTSSLTFASIPATLVVGDWIAIAQQSPLVQLPDESVPLLVTWTSERILYAVGDFDGADRLRGDAQLQEKDYLMIIQPRIEGERTKIVNRNGLLRARGFNYWRVRGGYYY